MLSEGTQRDSQAAVEVSPSLRRELLGVARLAVFVVDDAGCISHWNHAAEELFGQPAALAIGRPLDALCTLAEGFHQPDRPWCGVRDAACGDTPARAVAWWVYPSNEMPGTRLVAFATDANQLDGSGLHLAVDDRHIDPPTAEPLDHQIQVLRAEPILAGASSDNSERLRRYVAGALPRMVPETRDRITRHVLDCGYPSVNLISAGGVPLTPYRAAFRRPHPSGPLPVPGSGRTAPGREDAEDFARRRMSFLGEAAEAIGDTLDAAATARQLADALVPDFGDFASVELLDDHGQDEDPTRGAASGPAMLCRAAVAHGDQPGRWNDTMPEGERLQLPEQTPFGECVASAEPVLIPLLDGVACDQIAACFGDRDLRPLLEGRSLLTVPLVIRGRVLGYVMVVRSGDRRSFDEMDLTTARELARQSALCMDNAELYHRQTRTARALQASMLPAEIPRLTGVEVVHRYRPGSVETQVGGDWFDVIPLGSSRVAFVAGDVMGHGLHSAAAMGQLRTAIRTLSALDLPLDQVFRHLDDLTQRLGDGYYATCVYAVYDPVLRQCSVVNAGHAAPVLIDPQGHSERMELPPGAPVGIGGVVFEPVELDVADGSTIVFCTDGMVELREGRLAGLCRDVAGPDRSLDEMCDGLLDDLTVGDRTDDVGLLAARLQGVPYDDVASWTLEADPTVVRHARALTRVTLDAWGLIELADTVELLVSELVTNAVRHVQRPVGLRLLRTDVLLCEVTDDDQRLPTLCVANTMDEGGRGIHMVNMLAQRWGASRTASGKVVWFEHALTDGEPD